MKNILLYIMIIFIYYGCSTNQPEYIDMETTQYEYSSDINNNKIIAVARVDTNIAVTNEKSEKESIEELENNKIVLFYSSSKIGKYALDVTNTVNTYLLYKNVNFNLELYDLDKISIDDIYNNIKNNNITKVIAVVTKENLAILDIFNDSNINIYLPLINKENIKEETITNKNILFGGISYEKQFSKLLNYRKSTISELYSKSYIGDTLHKYMKNHKMQYSKMIKDKRPNYRKLLRDKRLRGTSLVLNTSIIQSSIILSQLRALRVRTKNILSTQLNYTPLLFSLTQMKDRKNIIISNSIGYIPDDLIVYNNITGNNILYSWVNYSTIIGLEYLLNKDTKVFNDIVINSNQVDYNIELYVVNKHSFKKIN